MRGKQEVQAYNKSFSESELKTASGDDSIHPQIIKMLPAETKKCIIDLYNRIWIEGKIPNSSIIQTHHYKTITKGKRYKRH